MTEDLNLPASLERLEINPERAECCKGDKNPFNFSTVLTEPECGIQNLSLKAECPKGHCLCNRKKEKDGGGLKKVTHFKRPILKKSRLSGGLLRAPLLRIKDPQPTLAEETRTKEKSMASSLPETSELCGGAKRSLSSEELSSLPPRSSAQSSSSPASCCSVQARNACDDTTMDELACYFDLLVHIPKKMSLMAEMMYI